MYIFVHFLFVFLSIPSSWLPNSLFLLDTGGFICPTTSCRSCQRTFLPGFHRLGECACFSWLSTVILCLSESVDFLSLLGMYLPVFLVLLVCVCVCVCVTVCTGRQTDAEERDRRNSTSTRARTHTCRDRSRSSYTHIHSQTHKYVRLLVFFSEYT